MLTLKNSCLDVSQDYFVQDLNKLFKAGQDLDVWVKFINVNDYKLGLQLFPLTTQPNEGLSTYIHIHTVHTYIHTYAYIRIHTHT